MGEDPRYAVVKLGLNATRLHAKDCPTLVYRFQPPHLLEPGAPVRTILGMERGWRACLWCLPELAAEFPREPLNDEREASSPSLKDSGA